MTLHLAGDVGQQAFVFYGLDPLDPPLATGKGPFYVGALANGLFVGTIPSGGRIDLPFTVPPLHPALAGIPLVMQGYVPGALSNPATLPLDQAYYVPAEAMILESPNPTNVGKFGDKVVTGDLNDDGEMDIAVGAWFEDVAGIDRAGRSYVFWGPAFTSQTTLEPPTPKTYGFFGQGLFIGDIDGDGIDDLVVGEGNGDPPPPTDPGHLYLFLGSATLASSPALTVSSVGVGSPYQGFGRVMALSDFDGDGRADVAVGVPFATVQGLANAGQVEVYWGPDLSSRTVVIAPDLAVSGFLGDELRSADVDGDGVCDLIVGAPRKKLGSWIAMGRVYLFVGPTLDHLATIDHPLPDGPNSRFGNAVAAADIDGDGLLDIVATDQRNHAFALLAPTYVEYLMLTRPPDPVSGTAIDVSFGYFAEAGDANGDGWPDIVIGNPFADSGAGRVYVALGPYLATFLVLKDKLPMAPAEFGWGMHLGDLDADGRLELLVGSDLATAAGVLGAGHVTVFQH
jgi:hypothetical protein